MLLNGLVTGVHSSADNIVAAAAAQYSAGVGAGETKERKKISHNFLAQLKS